MTRWMRVSVLLAAAVFLAGSISEAAIRKVGRRYNVIDAYGGYAMPHGSYDGMGDVDFVDEFGRLTEFDADEWLDETYFFGFDYGTLRGGHVLYQVGFRFTDHNVKDVFVGLPADDIEFRQYDLEINVNFFAARLPQAVASPYVGLGAQGGFTTFEIKGAANDESQLKFAMSVNFGLDFRLWTAPQQRSFVTLSSINNWNFVSSDDRPRYLNIGGGIKYYFRM